MSSPSPAFAHSPLNAIRTLKNIFSRQGTIVASFRTYNGRKLGPYYRLAYRAEGCQRSIYLGKSKKILRQVRRLLEKLQKTVKTKRFMCQAQKTFQKMMKKHQAQFRIDLLKVGLQLRGYAARGWRRYRRLLLSQYPPHAPYQGLRTRLLNLLSSLQPPMRGPNPRNCPFAAPVDQKPAAYGFAIKHHEALNVSPVGI
jgi:hypothetical protein